MTFRAAGAIFAIGLIALSIGLFFPGAVDAAIEDTDTSVELGVGESEEIIDDILKITVDDINTTTSSANVTVQDITNFRSSTVNISEGSKEVVTIEGENVGVDLFNISETPNAIMDINHSPTYGWDNSVSKVASNMDTILVLLGFLLARSSLVVAIE